MNSTTTQPRRRTRPTIETYYAPRFLALLDARTCTHGDPKGPRYCAICRLELRQLASGAPITTTEAPR